MFLEINKDNIEYEVSSDFVGGSLKGTVNTTYDKLKELFGKPTVDTGDPYEKVQCEWVIEGKVYFTDEYGDKDWEYVKGYIYNWKTGGSVPLDEYDWHIGGENYDVVEMIQTIVENELQPEYNWND